MLEIGDINYITILKRVLFLLLLLVPFGSVAIIIFLFISVVIDPRKIPFAFHDLFIIFLLNPIVFQTADPLFLFLRSLFSIFTFFIILYCLFLKKIKLYKVDYYIILFFIALHILTLVSSYNVAVSLFKLYLFFFTIFSIKKAFDLNFFNRSKWIDNVFNTWLLIISLSLPFISIKSIGYARNGTGFQGLANHPQAFGVYLGVFISILLANFLFIRFNTKKLAIIIMGLTFMFMSEARTSFVTLILGFLMVIISLILHTVNWKFFLRPFKNPATYIMIIILSSTVALNFGTVSESFYSFVYKRNQSAGDLGKAFETSRGFLVLLQMENIRNNPYTGIGFQLASIPKLMHVKYDPFFGIPISASIEKGVFFTAIVEEIGIIGCVFFLVMVLSWFRYIIKYRDLSSIWFFSTAFFVNFSESVFFSIGGLGLFCILIFSFLISKNN